MASGPQQPCDEELNLSRVFGTIWPRRNTKLTILPVSWISVALGYFPLLESWVPDLDPVLRSSLEARSRAVVGAVHREKVTRVPVTAVPTP